jgi:peptide/nickel transport system permease protein
LLVTFALSAFSPVDRCCKSSAIMPASRPTIRFAISWARSPAAGAVLALSGQPAHGDLGTPAPPASRCCTTCWRLSATLELATLALIVGALFWVIAGVLCARYAGSPWDLAVRTFTLFGNSVPIFWLGLLMLALFYAKLQWAPGPGASTIFISTPSSRAAALR